MDTIIDQKKDTVVTVNYTEFESNSLLTKTFTCVDGKIEKAPAAQMTKGIATRMTSTWHVFCTQMKRANSNTAFGYGVFSPELPDKMKIAVNKRADAAKGTIARTKENFNYPPSTGIIMIDHDPSPFGPNLSPADLLAILIEIHPDIAKSAKFFRGSVSSGIYKKGESPLPSKGFHLYIAVAYAADIPRYGQTIFERLWLLGHGFIALSNCGNALVRSVIDATVFSPERIDFVGKPVIQGDGLSYTDPEGELIDGCLLDTSTLPSLTDAEQLHFQELVDAAKAKIKSKANKQNKLWKNQTVASMTKKGIPEKEAQHTVDKICSNNGQLLHGSFPLFFSSSGEATVDQVLAAPSDYDEQALADPIEGVEYGPTTAKFYYNEGNPVINSMAHGGCIYYLKGKKREPTVSKNKATWIEDGDIFSPKATENPVLVELRNRGFYLKSLGNGHHEITCPWANEHQASTTTNKATFIEPSTELFPGSFKCPHCSNAMNSLLLFLNIQRRDAKHKPTIRCKGGELDAIIDIAEQLIATTGQYFQQAGLIVQVSTDYEQTTRIKPLNKASTQRLLTSIAVWTKSDKRSSNSFEVDCPPIYASTLHDSIEFKHLPPLLALSRQPFFRADGSLSQHNGYDEQSFIFGVYDPHDFTIPTNPSRNDAEKSLQLIKSLLTEFAFKSAQDEAAALATIFNATVRSSLPTAPGTLATAHSYGGGKSYLLDIFIAFATPSVVSGATFTNDDTEMTKQILATLMEGVPVIKFDEMKSDLLPIKTLLTALTASSIEGRILGVSKIARPSTRALMLFAGNNVSPLSDTTRRVLTVELDPQIEHPASRLFNNNPLQEIRQNRGLYVSAVLTIIKAWIDAGRPRSQVTPLNGYELWSDYCRQPLLWLGMADPCARIFQAMDKDPDRQTLGRLLKAWYEAFKDEPKKIKDVRQYINENNTGNLFEIIHYIAPEQNGHENKHLGFWLKKRIRRIVSGLRFEKDDTVECNVDRWKVVLVDPDLHIPTV